MIYRRQRRDPKSSRVSNLNTVPLLSHWIAPDVRRMKSMMLHDVYLPTFASTYRRVIKVLVEVGDEVRLDTDVLEIETEMATVYVPSTRKGIVVRLYIHPGQNLEFGQPILQVQVNPP